jgi:hypothetical protein
VLEIGLELFYAPLVCAPLTFCKKALERRRRIHSPPAREPGFQRSVEIDGGIFADVEASTVDGIIEDNSVDANLVVAVGGNLDEVENEVQIKTIATGRVEVLNVPAPILSELKHAGHGCVVENDIAYIDTIRARDTQSCVRKIELAERL